MFTFDTLEHRVSNAGKGSVQLSNQDALDLLKLVGRHGELPAPIPEGFKPFLGADGQIAAYVRPGANVYDVFPELKGDPTEIPKAIPLATFPEPM